MKFIVSLTILVIGIISGIIYNDLLVNILLSLGLICCYFVYTFIFNKKMKYHYFISFMAVKDGKTYYGHCIKTNEHNSLNEIAESIVEDNGVDDVIILYLKELTEEEYQILIGRQ